MTSSVQTSKYRLVGSLKGHRGAILCMSATDDGKLASGGVDGVKLWCLRKRQPVPGPVGAGARGATTALTWVRREDEPDDGLVYGTQNGYVVCWRQVGSDASLKFEEAQVAKVANPGEVTGLAFDASSNRLAMCNRNSVIQLYSIDDMMLLHTIFSVTVEHYLPKFVTFSAPDDSSVMVFGMLDGNIHRLRAKDGEIEHTTGTGGMIGSADLNSKKGVFCIDDPSQGVGLYRLGSAARLRTFPVPVKRSMRPRQVAFADDCRVIVSGSDHGTVYVFNRRNGDILDKLEFGGRDWVQTITTADFNGVSMILAAKSRDSEELNDIILWKKTTGVQKEREAETVQEPGPALVLVQFLMLVATVIFLWQNAQVFAPCYKLLQRLLRK